MYYWGAKSVEANKITKSNEKTEKNVINSEI